MKRHTPSNTRLCTGGATAPAAPVPPFGIAALLSGPALARRRVREIRAMSGVAGPVPARSPDAFDRSPVRPPSWRGMALWSAAVLLLGAALLWGCADGDDLVRPVSMEPDAGRSGRPCRGRPRHRCRQSTVRSSIRISVLCARARQSPH